MTLSPTLPPAQMLTALASAGSIDDGTTRRTGAVALAAGLAAASSQWLPLVEYRPAGRWTRLLSAGEAAPMLDPSLHADLAAAQVWLLSWLPDQGTALHDHGRSAGAFAVVHGTLTERIVAGGPDPAVRQSTADLAAGRIRHFGPHYVHQVTNTAHEPAVSVHVYSPRLIVMNTYAIKDNRLVHTGSERAGVDW